MVYPSHVVAIPDSPSESPVKKTEDYHADYNNGDSHSSLELFRESPAKYAAIRVFRTIQPDPPTAGMKVGQALHALAFEYEQECRFIVRKNRTNKVLPGHWSEQRNSILAKQQLSPKDAMLVWAMITAISCEPDAWNLLVEQPGFNERAYHITDPASIVRIKCKPDRVLANGLVVDLKTVDGPVDPSSWSRTLAKWGYHRQAAFYLDVLKLLVQKADMFVFVAVSKDPPHEIGIYVIDEESIEQGRRENRELLERLAECRRTGNWKHEWQGKILTAGVPRWAIER